MTQSLKVLLVDDENDIVFVLKRGLELKGIKVAAFSDPEDAVQKFRPNYYDAVITDIRMPNMNGFELYQKIRKNDAAVQVYFMSAFDMYEKEVNEKFSTDELVKFLEKPIIYSKLAEMLRKDLGKKRATI